MADYKFKKPWASESQNVKTFTEEEWGTGIVEKSLVSSSQVNGVMQQVTSRFLALEAVEDKQYRYDFIVDNEESWNNFIKGNISRSVNSVLVRSGEWVADTKVKLMHPALVAIESGATVQFNAGVERSTDSSPVTIFGSTIVAGTLTSCTFVSGGLIALSSVTFEETTLKNMTLFTPPKSSISITGGSYFNSTIETQTANITGAKFVDCKIKGVKFLSNCTLVRCTIPNNTPLAYCTVIDCDYTVDTYKDNLVTDTTFRNCNLSFTTTGTSTGAVCNYTNKAYGSKITFTLSKSEHVSMLVYDSQIVFYRSGNTCLFTDSQFFGKSYMDVFGAADTDLINALSVMKDSNGSIITDIPFFRDGSNFRMYISSDTIYPGVINVINNKNSRNLLNFAKQKYFLRYGGGVSTSSITYGVFEFLPWCDFKRYQNTDDSYNIEFILKS